MPRLEGGVTCPACDGRKAVRMMARLGGEEERGAFVKMVWVGVHGGSRD